MTLEPISTESVIAYYERYYVNADHNYHRNAKIVDSLVRDYPSHNLIDHVLPKAIVINKLYSTNIMAIDKIAEYITTLNIEEVISQGNFEAVDLITSGHGIKAAKTEKEIKFYSFATKYCYCHNKSAYLIYDSYVDCALQAYNEVNTFWEFSKDDLKDYQRYTEIYRLFKEKNEIKEIDNSILDKFLWRQGDQILRERKAARLERKRKASV